jgi:hypothetical protein
MSNTINLNSLMPDKIETVSRICTTMSVVSIMNKKFELISKVYADVYTKSVGK